MKRISAILIALALVLLQTTALAQGSGEHENFKITLALSKKSTAVLTDDNVKTYLSLPEGERISIICEGAGAIMLKWYTPAAYNITYENADFSLHYEEYDDDILNKYLPLNGAGSIVILLPSGGKLSDIIFFDEGVPEVNTQDWQEPYDKADLLVLSAHPDDEYLYMGGTIPYYGAERGLNVVVVWMSHQKRIRQDEALSALWAMDVHHYPEFLGFPDKLKKDYNSALKYWGEEKTLGSIVEIFRKYRPEVVVTHDLKGEYGHGAHMVTANLALEAATLAADPLQFPESAAEFGTWQIKKLYLHLYKENQILMDWRQPLEVFNGKTAFDMAKVGYSYHESQHVWDFMVSDTSQYSCAKFGLAYTTVGLDVAKNDFLENIPAESLSDYVTYKPEPTCMPEPSPAHSPKPTVKHIEELPVLTATAEDVKTSAALAGPNVPGWTIAVAGVAVFAFIAAVLIVRLKRNNKIK